ncbi:arginase family protein [Paraburkholderia piptadeniae]|uniref:arginase family protein n=1 Tax=Paraburkholderia piptadeniae TaxID=1701573 RepID=UPI0034DD911B
MSIRRRSHSWGCAASRTQPAESSTGRDLGVRFYTMEEFCERGLKPVMQEAIERVTDGTDRVCCTFDTDVLDHAAALATQFPGPLGLPAYDAMRLVQGFAQAGAGAFMARRSG